ncbi:MAG: membrane protein insertion efficiency factor YidD [Desulfobulbus sp.]|nr:membrane protein insertion efficiency factor YidD [Desulfobulbus sp.]
MCQCVQLKKIPDDDSCHVSVRRMFVRRFFIIGLRGYQYFISPLFPPSCRFVPTCSQYAIDAIIKYGVWRGSVLALKRIVRCHPWCRGGYDPVK